MSEQEKSIIQDCNVNFLIGSGLSCPYLRTLGNIEKLLTDLENSSLDPTKKKVIRASLYNKFFTDVISKNTKIIEGDASSAEVLKHYVDFLRIWNSILLKRKSTILGKEVNLFTTNVDVFLDKALEDLGAEYNDGFNGRFKPSFSLSNFKKSRFKRSLHFDNTAEIPVFNLLKLHGSLSWTTEDDQIIFSPLLDQVNQINGLTLSSAASVAVRDDSTLATLAAAASGKVSDASVSEFLAAYNKLLIVNPTKAKFKLTLLEETYYELLRLYSNELEKENTVLYVMGFSFADEHIRDITLRAANSNPTLLIHVLAYNAEAKRQIEERFNPSSVKNRNIKFISPPTEVKGRSRTPVEKFQYNLQKINSEIFQSLFADTEGDAS